MVYKLFDECVAMRMGFVATLVDLGRKCDFHAAKANLMRDADAAFYDNDKDLCLDTISRLYDLCDIELKAA